MNRNKLKLAVYLDEAGEEPASGCRTLINNNINHVVLRHCWTHNVCDLSDIGHQKLINIINEYNIIVVCIASNLGKINIDKLSKIKDNDINKIINIASYYKASMIRFFIGNNIKTTTNNYYNTIDEWMCKIGEKCIDNNITPLLEITPESYIYKSPEIAKLFMTHKYWKLLYDPVQFILRQNQDPFIQYWTLLKNRIGAFDVRDMKIGKGFKPFGFGDAKINMTIKDTQNFNYSGWFFLEPSLGRHYMEAQTKQDTFVFALESFDTILQQI